MILNRNKKMNVGAYILSLVVVFMLIVVFFIMYKYQVEGEAIPPFNISKMVVVSSAKTENLELVEGIYNADIVQTNDIKISIQKNPKYKKEAIIKNEITQEKANCLLCKGIKSYPKEDKYIEAVAKLYEKEDEINRAKEQRKKRKIWFQKKNKQIN